MKLAFNGQGRYADFRKGYELYVKRSKLGKFMSEEMYRKVVRSYCRMLADTLENEGIVDLPGGLGSIAAATLTRKPQYRGKKFIGYGKYDWNRKHYDGQLKTFGMVFLPRRERTQNLRCYGFVANRRLFQRMKDMYDRGTNSWYTMEYNDKMI